jgi:hypothetical protein
VLQWSCGDTTHCPPPTPTLIPAHAHLHDGVPHFGARAAIRLCQGERRLEAAGSQRPGDAILHVTVAADDDVLCGTGVRMRSGGWFG